MKKKCQKNGDKNKTLKHNGVDLFSVQEIEGRGKGIISVQKIQLGTVILKETPLLTIKHSESSNFEEWAQRVVDLVNDLPKDKKEKYLNLADNEYFNSSPEFQYLKSVKNFSQESLQYVRILRTNGINIDEEGKMTGVYDNFSRLNHSCGPNSIRNINCSYTGEISVIATRDIEEGEEIHIKYFDMETASLQRMARKMKLLNWGFNCICDICNLKDKALEENENLRTKLQSAKIALQKCPTDPFNITSLKKQMVIEKLIIQLLRELSTQMIGDFVDHLMSLVHVGKLLKCHGEKVQDNLDEVRTEAHHLVSQLGSKFMDQYLYWENLTTNCCKSVTVNLNSQKNK